MGTCGWLGDAAGTLSVDIPQRQTPYIFDFISILCISQCCTWGVLFTDMKNFGSCSLLECYCGNSTLNMWHPWEVVRRREEQVRILSIFSSNANNSHHFCHTTRNSASGKAPGVTSLSRKCFLSIYNMCENLDITFALKIKVLL